MNACRIAILVPVVLILFSGLATAQVTDPAVIPPAEPPAAEVPAPIPADQPPVPPMGFPPNQFPGVPDAGIPGAAADIPGAAADMPSNLPKLDRNFDAELSTEELGLVLAPRWEQRRRAVRGSLPAEPSQLQPQLPVTPEAPLGNERPRFEVYPLRDLDPTQTLAALQQLLQGQPDARLTFDGRSRSILVLAPPSAQAKVREALASLLAGDRAGLPGLPPAMEQTAAPLAELPVVPRVVPLYNARSPEILRIVRQVYRDRIVEPRADQAAGNPLAPGLPPVMVGPTVPAGKMVIGEGAAPNTIAISAQDELFFEVVDLIERLDESLEPPSDAMEVPPPR